MKNIFEKISILVVSLFFTIAPVSANTLAFKIPARGLFAVEKTIQNATQEEDDEPWWKEFVYIAISLVLIVVHIMALSYIRNIDWIETFAHNYPNFSGLVYSVFLIGGFVLMCYFSVLIVDFIC